MPCTLSQQAQHDLRNGVMALSWALSQLYRSPIFSQYATQKELAYLQTAQHAAERLRSAVEPCGHRPECAAAGGGTRMDDGGFWS